MAIVGIYVRFLGDIVCCPVMKFHESGAQIDEGNGYLAAFCRFLLRALVDKHRDSPVNN